MTINDLDVRLNRAAQGIDPVAHLAAAFDVWPEQERREAVRRLVLLALQAGARAEDATTALATSGVKPRRTAAVLLVKPGLEAQLGKIANLPETELRDALLLALALLSIADGRRRATRCAVGCSHWWHGELRDEAELLDAGDAVATKLARERDPA